MKSFRNINFLYYWSNYNSCKQELFLSQVVLDHSAITLLYLSSQCRVNSYDVTDIHCSTLVDISFLRNTSFSLRVSPRMWALGMEELWNNICKIRNHGCQISLERKLSNVWVCLMIMLPELCTYHQKISRKNFTRTLWYGLKIWIFHHLIHAT